MDQVFSQALTGYRYWVFKKGFLMSPALEDPWKGPSKVAKCKLGHLSPDPGCECGIYANFSLKETTQSLVAAQEIWQQFWGPDPQNGELTKIVFGMVAFGGKTEIHQKGIRGEKAQILLLGKVNEIPEMNINRPYQKNESLKEEEVASLKNRYKVPVLGLKAFKVRALEILKNNAFLTEESIAGLIPKTEKSF